MSHPLDPMVVVVEKRRRQDGIADREAKRAFKEQERLRLEAQRDPKKDFLPVVRQAEAAGTSSQQHLRYSGVPGERKATQRAVEIVGPLLEGETLVVRADGMPSSAHRLEYVWKRKRPGVKQMEFIEGSKGAQHVLDSLDVGCGLEVVVSPVDRRGELVGGPYKARVVDIEAGPPTLYAVTIQGAPLSTTRFELDGRYGGGALLRIDYQWFKSVDLGDSWRPISRGTGDYYQATSEDVNALLKCHATPYRADYPGVTEGDTVVATMEQPILLDKDIAHAVKGKMRDGKADFDVRHRESMDKDPVFDEAASLTVSRDYVSLYDGDRQLFNSPVDTMSVLFHPEDVTVSKVIGTSRTDVAYIRFADFRARDVFALTVFHFAHRDPALHSKSEPFVPHTHKPNEASSFVRSLQSS